MKITVLKSLTFENPGKADVVIFDSYSERHFRPVLNGATSLVFDTSLSKLNFWILVYSLRFGLPSLRNYFCAFVHLSGARVVVTTIDNSPVIYQVKDVIPTVILIVVQNGRRSTFGRSPNTSFTDELLKNSKRRRNAVDYYFTFGTTEISQFQNLIETTFLPIGSMKNNYLEIDTRKELQKTVSYISSFPNFDSDPSASVDSDDTYLFFQDQPISFRQYFRSEGLVAQWLAQYCTSHGFNFQIVGKRSSRTFQEEEYFRKLIPGSWTFVPCNSERDSYDALMQSDVVASVDSTLAYEMFGRGIRTMFFTVRSTFIECPELLCTRFGYPEIPESSGPMWTNNYDFSEFNQIADFVTNCSDDEWQSVVETYSPVVMKFDPLNFTLMNTIFQHLEKHPPAAETVRAMVAEVYG